MTNDTGRAINNTLHSQIRCRSVVSIVLIVEECRRVVDEMAFGVWDYVVFVTTLLISAGIGVYVRFSGGRQKTAEVREIRLIVLRKPEVAI